MEDDLFVPPKKKIPTVRYVLSTVMLQCAVCGNPLDIKAKTEETKHSTVYPCRFCMKLAREEAASPYMPQQVFSGPDKKAIEARIKELMEGKESHKQ